MYNMTSIYRQRVKLDIHKSAIQGFSSTIYNEVINYTFKTVYFVIPLPRGKRYYIFGLIFISNLLKEYQLL